MQRQEDLCEFQTSFKTQTNNVKTETQRSCSVCASVQLPAGLVQLPGSPSQPPAPHVCHQGSPRGVGVTPVYSHSGSQHLPVLPFLFRVLFLFEGLTV